MVDPSAVLLRQRLASGSKIAPEEAPRASAPAPMPDPFPPASPTRRTPRSPDCPPGLDGSGSPAPPRAYQKQPLPMLISCRQPSPHDLPHLQGTRLGLVCCADRKRRGVQRTVANMDGPAARQRWPQAVLDDGGGRQVIRPAANPAIHNHSQCSQHAGRCAGPTRRPAQARAGA